MKLIVYIAGPISDPDFATALQNIARFFHMEALLIRHGFAPINPAADIIAAIVAGDFVYDDFLGKDEPLVKKSDVLMVLNGWSSSEGATQEVEWAHDAANPVFERLIDLLEYRDTVREP